MVARPKGHLAKSKECDLVIFNKQEFADASELAII